MGVPLPRGLRCQGSGQYDAMGYCTQRGGEIQVELEEKKVLPCEERAEKEKDLEVASPHSLPHFRLKQDQRTQKYEVRKELHYFILLLFHSFFGGKALS